MININDVVRVRLTASGRATVLAAKGKSIREDVDGWSTWQLWDLMHTFGACLYSGTNDLPFVNNEIVLDKIT